MYMYGLTSRAHIRVSNWSGSVNTQLTSQGFEPMLQFIWWGQSLQEAGHTNTCKRCPAFSQVEPHWVPEGIELRIHFQCTLNSKRTPAFLVILLLFSNSAQSFLWLIYSFAPYFRFKFSNLQTRWFISDKTKKRIGIDWLSAWTINETDWLLVLVWVFLCNCQ